MGSLCLGYSTLSGAADQNEMSGEGSNLWRLGFEHDNNMYSAASRKEKTRYQYDALGRLVIKKNVNRTSTKFTYEGQDVILDDVDGAIDSCCQNPLGDLRANFSGQGAAFIIWRSCEELCDNCQVGQSF